MSTDLFKSGFAIPGAGAGASTQSLCPSDLPLVLLPVRLETRFFTLANGSTELRVRIYPDKIHLDSHEPELTTDEQSWGQHYWQQDWLAGSDSGARSDAWRQIADRFGTARGLDRPHAAADQCDSASDLAHSAGAIANGCAGFPGGSGRDSGLCVASGTSGAIATRPLDRRRAFRWSSRVDGHRQGHSKAARRRAESAGTIAGSEECRRDRDRERRAVGHRYRNEMKWMTDFDAAETAGMALRIAIPPATLAAGLDSLVVFGVAKSLSVAETAAQLADLLDAHHYTDGLAFLRPGTPTNNTDDRRADYSSQDPGHAAQLCHRNRRQHDSR